MRCPPWHLHWGRVDAWVLFQVTFLLESKPHVSHLPLLSILDASGHVFQLLLRAACESRWEARDFGAVLQSAGTAHTSALGVTPAERR